MRKFHFFSIVVLNLCLFSCSVPRYIYAPSAVNVPIIIEKGESKLSALLSTSSGSSGVDLQAAYSITDHIMVQASHMQRREESNYRENRTPINYVINYKRNLTEAGVGYYTSISKKKDFYFQVFGGAGTGRSSFTDVDVTAGNYERFHIADITKLYLQPAFLLFPTKNFSISAALRFSNINYKKIDTDYSDFELTNNNLNDLEGKNLLFMEPTFIFNFRIPGFSALLFDMQWGGTSLISRSTIPYYYRKGIISIGASFDLTKLKQAQK